MATIFETKNPDSSAPRPAHCGWRPVSKRRASWLLDPHAPCLLGRLRATITGSVSVGDRLVVMGWPVEKDGRKLNAGTAVFSEYGELKGLAPTTWINLR